MQKFLSTTAALALTLGALLATQPAAHAYGVLIDDTVSGQLTITGNCFGYAASFVRVNGSFICTGAGSGSVIVGAETATIAATWDDGGSNLDQSFAFYLAPSSGSSVATDVVSGNYVQDGAFPQSFISFVFTSGTGLLIPSGAVYLGAESDVTGFFAVGYPVHLVASGGSSGVPEPGTLLLLGMGLAGAGVAWRRKRQSA